MLYKIYFTALFVLVFSLIISWVLVYIDEKHEYTWYKTTLTILMLLIIFIFVGIIEFIWLNKSI